MDAKARARVLALAGIEVRATTADAGGGGGKTAHEPAGSPKGGQFTSRPGSGGPKSKPVTHRPPKKAVPAQSTPQAPATPRLVKEGDSGEDVRYAQYAMSLLGFKVAQDGQFGPETAAAVKQMQERLGVKHPNGHITPALLHKMQDAVRLSPCVGSQRDLAFEAQWELRDDGLEDDLDFDETAEAVLDALDEFERSASGDWAERAAHDVSKELRIPGGKGGGRWTKSPITAAIAHALEEWAKGNGPDDPFVFDGKPIDREPLRKAAVARGITLRRGAGRDEIVKALKADVTVKVREAKAAKPPEVGKPVRFTLKGKDHRNLDVGVFTEGGKVSLWEVSDSGERRKRVALVDDLAGLESWANEHGESELAGWARAEQGGRKGSGGALSGRKALASVPVQVSVQSIGSSTRPEDVRGLDRLTDRQRKAVIDGVDAYRGLGYKGINQYLRTGEDVRGAKTAVAGIDLGMAESRLPNDIAVFRTLQSGDFAFGPTNEWPDDLTGREWTDRGYPSTTTERAILAKQGNATVAMRLNVPAGTGAMKLSDFEAEVLLERGLKFRVVADHGPTEITDAGFGRSHKFDRYLDVEVVPGTAAPRTVSRPVVMPAGDETPTPRKPDPLRTQVKREDAYDAALAKGDVDAAMEQWAAHFRDTNGRAPTAGELAKQRVRAERQAARTGSAADGLDNGSNIGLENLAEEHELPSTGSRDELLARLRKAGVKPPPEWADNYEAPKAEQKPRVLDASEIAVLQSATTPGGLRRKPEMTGAGRQHNGRIDDLRREGYIKKEVGSDHYSLTDAGRGALGLSPVPGKATKAAKKAAPVGDVGQATSAKNKVPASAPRRMRASVQAELDRQHGLVPAAIAETGRVRLATATEWDDMRRRALVDENVAAVHTIPGHEIVLSPEWTTDRPALEKRLRGAYTDGQLAWSFPDYDVKKVDLAAGIVRHEVGHAVAGRWPIRQTTTADGSVVGGEWTQAQRERLIAPLADALGVPPPGPEQSVESWWGRPDVQGAARTRISGLATKNLQEALAEIWAVHSGRGQDANPIFQRIGPILQDEWGPGRLPYTLPGSKAAGDVDSLRALDTEARRDALDLRKVDELKALLKAQGLPVSGRKRELVDRLVESVHGGGAPNAAPPTNGPPKTVGRNIASEVDYQSLPPEYNHATDHDDALAEIVRRQGFDGKPQVVSRAEFDAAVKGGEVRETWRGVGRHTTTETPDQLAEAYRTGDFHVGLGINGNGTYVAIRKTDGEYYGPALLRIGLRKDARVISADDLDREMDAYFAVQHTTAKHQDLQRQMLAELAKAKSARARANIRRAYYHAEFYGPDRRSRLLAIQRDPGRFAALRGYDAIDIPKERSPDKHAEMIILNRTATIVQAAE